MSDKCNVRMVANTAPLAHLGHAYVALLNQHLAASTGGEFHLFRVRREEPIEEFLADLKWIGIKPKAVWSEDDPDERPGVAEAALSFKDEMETAFLYPADEAPSYRPTHTSSEAHLTEYSPWDMSLAVAWDHALGITDCILPERSMCDGHLRTYLALRQGFAVPRQWYIPSLAFTKDAIPDVDFSFSMNLHGLRKKGWNHKEVLELLARSCLKNPEGPWALDNIKAQPILDIGGSGNVDLQRVGRSGVGD